MDDIVIPDGRWAGFVMVHADGGTCHGTPLRRDPHVPGSAYCPGCGTTPDMQSREYWSPNSIKR